MSPRQFLPEVLAPGQQAFAVLSTTPVAGPAAPGTISAACQNIPGVHGLRVDAERGKIHVLYDGSTSAITQVSSVLRKSGFSIRRPEDGPSSMRHVHAWEEEPG